jgi:spore maturation protein CgeB
VRVLLVHPGPHFSVADVYNGLHKGLVAAGCEVATLNLDERLEFYMGAHARQHDDSLIKAFDKPAAIAMAAQGLEVACYEFWPDVVIVVSGWFVPESVWKVLAQRPHKVVLWATESPYEDAQQATAGQYADVVVLNDPANLAAWCEHVNPNTFYRGHSYDPDVHYPGDADPELVYDFGFVGTGFPSRLAWLEQVDWSGLTVGFGGNWQGVSSDSPLASFLIHDNDQCMDNRVAADLYRSVTMSANLYRKESAEGGHSAGWAMGPREVELAACGTFFFREPRGEGDGLFPTTPMLPEDPKLFRSHIDLWMGRPDDRAAVVRYNRDAVADRTFGNTAIWLLELVA